MDRFKLLQVINLYRRKFAQKGVISKAHPTDKQCICPDAALSHCVYLLDQAEMFAKSKKFVEAAHNVGFVQAILWECGVYTLEDLQKHMRVR